MVNSTWHCFLEALGLWQSMGLKGAPSVICTSVECVNPLVLDVQKLYRILYFYFFISLSHSIIWFWIILVGSFSFYYFMNVLPLERISSILFYPTFGILATGEAMAIKLFKPILCSQKVCQSSTASMAWHTNLY